MGLRPDAKQGSRESWTRPTKARGDGRGGLAAGSWPRGAIMGLGGNRVRELARDFPSERVPESVPDSPRSPSQIASGAPLIPSELVPDPPRSPSRMPPGACPRSPWSWTLSPCAPCSPGQVPLESARVCSALPARRRAHQWGRTRPGAGSRAPFRSALLCSGPPSPRLGPGLAVVRPLSPRAWIDLVALASGSRNRPASTARLPIPGAQPARRSPSLTRAQRAPAAV